MKKRERERETHIDRRTVDGKREREIHWKGQTQRERERDAFSSNIIYVWHFFFTDTSDKPSMLYIHIIYLWHYHFTNTYDKQSMYTPHCCSPDKYNYCIHRQRERIVLGNSIARCKSNQVILSMKFKCISMFKLRTLFYINLNIQKKH